MKSDEYLAANEKNKECMPYAPVIAVDTLARAYIPMQNLCTIYREDECIKHGTAFPELFKPYKGHKKMDIFEREADSFEQ